MKKQKRDSDLDEKFFPIKYKSVRTCPSDRRNNAMELTASKKYKIDSLEEYIDTEIYEQARIFEIMECDPNLVKIAIDGLKKTYESAK